MKNCHVRVSAALIGNVDTGSTFGESSRGAATYGRGACTKLADVACVVYAIGNCHAVGAWYQFEPVKRPSQGAHACDHAKACASALQELLRVQGQQERQEEQATDAAFMTCVTHCVISSRWEIPEQGKPSLGCFH